MRSSIFGSIFLIIIALYLIRRLGKGENSNKYQAKPKNNWTLLSEGKDPTIE